MYSRSWQIIKDDSRRTYEVCGQVDNTNPFTNKIVGMQRAGMNVSWVLTPVTNKNSSKSVVKVSGYTQEDGLLEKLSKQFDEIIRGGIDFE